MATSSLVLPLPQPEVERDVLGEFIRESQLWSAERVPIPARLRRALWILIPIDLVWSFWLATIMSINPCASRVCGVATLDPYTPVLLGCAAVSLICVVVVAISTRGMAQADSHEVTGLTIATVTGGVALVGIAALILVALIAGLVLAAFWVAFTFQF